ALRPRRWPDLRPLGHGGRRLGGRRRPRVDRRDGTEAPDPGRRQALDPPRMIWSSWICLGLPLGAAFAITLAGNRISRRTAGFLATASTLGSFAAAVIAFTQLLGRPPNDRAHYSTLWSWLTAGSLHFDLRILV